MPAHEAMERNLLATLAVFGRANRSGETRDLAGVTVTSSGIQFSMFNSAILTSPVSTAAELEHRIRAAAGFFGNRKLDWSFWVCQDWIDQPARAVVGDVFDAAGMRLVVELPGMECERLEPPARPLPPLLIRSVSDPASRTDFSRIMSAAFGIPHPVSRAVYGSERTWGADFAGYVGEADGTAVTAAATMITDSLVGVYAVGTLAESQRKGYAEAVMRHALAEAQAASGLQRSVLQSSDAGLSLYRRMGYSMTTRYAVFAWS